MDVDWGAVERPGLETFVGVELHPRDNTCAAPLEIWIGDLGWDLTISRFPFYAENAPHGDVPAWNSLVERLILESVKSGCGLYRIGLKTYFIPGHDDAVRRALESVGKRDVQTVERWCSWVHELPTSEESADLELSLVVARSWLR